MHWLYLTIAIFLEVAGTTSMKFSQGFTKIVPSILMFAFYLLSLSFLTLALKKIDMSVAYTVWAGVGTALIAFVGVMYFNESWNVLKVASICFVIVGVIGLKLSAG